MEEFSRRLEASGYPIRVAGRIIRNGIVNYSRKVEKERKGEGNIHRQEDEGKLERRMGKLLGKNNWFRKQAKDMEGDEFSSLSGIERSGTGRVKQDPKTRIPHTAAKQGGKVRFSSPLFVQAW